MYTTPLSTLISSLSLDHHLADDTHLFFSFYPLICDSSISHFQNALQRISSWMTANLLTLNSSKTEFLLIGLKNQLAKIHNITLYLTPPTSLEILASSLTSILLPPTKLQLSPKPVTIIFVHFAVSSLISIRQLPVPLLPLSFTKTWLLKGWSNLWPRSMYLSSGNLHDENHLDPFRRLATMQQRHRETDRYTTRRISRTVTTVDY